MIAGKNREAMALSRLFDRVHTNKWVAMRIESLSSPNAIVAPDHVDGGGFEGGADLLALGELEIMQ